MASVTEDPGTRYTGPTPGRFGLGNRIAISSAPSPGLTSTSSLARCPVSTVLGSGRTRTDGRPPTGVATATSELISSGAPSSTMDNWCSSAPTTTMPTPSTSPLRSASVPRHVLVASVVRRNCQTRNRSLAEVMAGGYVLPQAPAPSRAVR